MSGAVAQYVAQVDSALAAGHGLFAQVDAPQIRSEGWSAAPLPDGVGALADGVRDTSDRYTAMHSHIGALDDDTRATSGDADALTRQGGMNAGAVRDTAQVQAGAIGPSTGSPAGVRLLVSTMDQRLADMQREIDQARAQNRLLALRLRQLALAYRGMPPATGGMPGLGTGSSPAFTAPAMGAPASGFSPASAPLTLARATAPLDAAADTLDPGPAGDGIASRAVAFARTKMGLPYIWGAQGPDSYDCSGLIRDAYAHQGVVLPRTTYDQIHCGQPVSRNDIRPGDLVFSNFSAPGVPEHVQMAVSATQVIEAPVPGGHVQLHVIASGPIEVRRVA